MRLKITVKTKSSKHELQHIKENEYIAYIHAPPIDGKANKELIELLSEYFDTAKSKISIISGKESKHKIIKINP